MNRPWRKSTRRRGASVVEMAVISPILITLVFGIIEFGWAFMVRQMLTNAAREGARVSAIQPFPDGENDSEVRSSVTDALAGINGLSVPDSAIEITRWCENGDGTRDYTETVKVTIPYTDISLLGNYFSWISFNDLVGLASMRKEGVSDQTPASRTCGS